MTEEVFDGTPYWKQLVAAQNNDSALRTRQDGDRDLYWLDPYKLRDAENKVVKRVISVTFNDPRVFADRIISMLSSLEMQPQIQSNELDNKQKNMIEEVIPLLLEQINRSLFQEYRIPDLLTHVADQLCLRGHAAARVIYNRTEDGVMGSSVLPYDVKNFTCVQGPVERGVVFGSYFTSRYRSQIMVDGSEIGKKLQLAVAENPTLDANDYWDRDVNIIFKGGSKTGGEVIHWRKHTIGYAPIITASGVYSSLSGESDYSKYNNESIFAANRDLYSELNRSASIMQTIAMMVVKAPMQKKVNPELIGTNDVEQEEDPYGLGVIIEMGVDEKYELMPIQDIKAASKMFFGALNERLQLGGLPTVEFGNISFPLSGSALSRLGASKDAIFLPRIDGISRFYQGMLLMLIDQIKKDNRPFKLGESGEQKEYSPDIFKGNYTLKFKILPNSKEDRAINYAEAHTAKEFLSDETILEDIVRVHNPKVEQARVRKDRLVEAEPLLMLINGLFTLIDEEGKDIEARVLLHTIINTIKQRKLVALNLEQQMQSLTQKTSSNGSSPLDNKPAEQNKNLPLFDSQHDRGPGVDRVGTAGDAEGEVDE